MNHNLVIYPRRLMILLFLLPIFTMATTSAVKTCPGEFVSWQTSKASSCIKEVFTLTTCVCFLSIHKVPNSVKKHNSVKVGNFIAQYENIKQQKKNNLINLYNAFIRFATSRGNNLVFPVRITEAATTQLLKRNVTTSLHFCN